MRCYACQVNLNDFESTRKSALTGEYVDLCNKCYAGTGIDTIDRPDLVPNEEMVDDLDPYEGEGDVDPEFSDDYNWQDERD